MDTSEKVKVFDTFEGLTKEIIIDRDSRDIRAQRYAVRFIMLNNFNEFRELAKFMSKIGVESLDLEDLISDNDSDEWITKDELKVAIKSCNNSTFVTPFSELVRFYNDDDFRGFFNEIMLLEDIHHPNKRIYMPLIGLQNRFTDFLNHFARIQESAPVWRYDAEVQSVEVYFAKYKDFVLPNGTVQCQLNNLREWLKFWKVQAPQERIVCTSRPIAAKYKYSKPDNIFNFTRIANAYEFMTQFLDLKFPFGYKEEENSYWEELLQKVDKTKIESFSFGHFVRSYFNKVKFDASEVILEWTDECRNDFERWLLRNYVLYTDFAESYPYIALCLDAVFDLSDASALASMIVTRILYDMPINKRTEYAEERREIILNNNSFFETNITCDEKNWLFERIKEVFQQQGNLDFAIDLCTGVFCFEKKLLMGWTVHNPQNKKLKETIERLYPEYVAYMSTNKPSHFNPQCLWVIDYLKSYKQARMEDRYTEEISSFIKQRNDSSASFYKWYFEFESSQGLLAEMQSNIVYRPDKIYWIDGLGLEHLSYLLYLIEHENSNMKVVRSQITRSELPTSTFHNRFYGDNVVKYGALDELGHDSHGYKHFDSLIQEFEILKKIVKEIINTSKKEKCTVAIVSDHGMSCLSRKAPSKKYDGKFEHEGRYIKTTDTALIDSDYLVHKNELDEQTYKVALSHSSLSKVPTHQVHGGCTPEEVLVPFILLSNKNVTNSVRYQIKLTSENILLSNPSVAVSIIPQPNNVTLTFNGKTFNMDRVGMNWSAVLAGISEGEHKIEIQPKGGECTELTIKVTGISGEGINDIMDF